MNRDVLIVDDDQEFSTLLRGVFEQAGYSVHAAFDAEQGLNIIRNETIDLLIVDQRLPEGMSGSDLIQKLRDTNTDIPLIMVSGFLNDDSIRDLIRNGVCGVFIKPLNIFSLLKKASEILDNESAQSPEANASAEKGASLLGGGIGGIRGLSAKGQDFLLRARDASGFKRNLLLIGPAGTLFEEIGRDILSLSGESEHCLILKPGTVTPESLHAPFKEGDAGSAAAFIVLDAEHLSPDEVDRLISFVDEKGGSSSSLRMVFCLSQTVEDLYDAGKIDEELYLFLGTNELKVPGLKDMPEDLLAIAREEIATQAGDCTFDARLRSLLLDHDWPENIQELRSVVLRAVNLAQPRTPSARHFDAAIHPERAAQADPRSSLERFLDQEKGRYTSALKILGLS